MTKYKNRKEVPEKYKWDLSDFFLNDKEFNETFKNCETNIKKINGYKNCVKDADKLYDFLELEAQTEAMTENLYVYAYLINDQELGNPTNIERKNKTLELYNKLSQSISFFAPSLLKLEEKEYNLLFEKNQKLNEYKVSLDKVYRDKGHVLTENEEKILSELDYAMDNYDDISSNLLNKEHNYGKIKLDDGTVTEIATNNYRNLLKNNNRDIRKKAYKSLNKVLNQYGGTSAGLLNSYVKKENSVAKIRNFKDSWNKRLFNLNLSNEVFEALKTSVFSNCDPIRKYYDLKKKILKLDKVYYYDLTVPINESKKEYTIPEAQELILESIKPLGSDYTKKFKKIFDNHYIDYCQYKGKCSGAYSFATSTHDSRILMSFNDDLYSVSTIIHEGGHNVHHQYITQNNPIQYRDQSNIVCEVASLTNECLLSSYLAKNGKTKEEKLSGIGNIIDVIISNLFGAVREGYIEQQMYDIVKKGGTLTQECMDKLTKKSFKKLFGNSLFVDKNIKNTWILRSHYFMNFYLYSYSISISVATNVASKILEGDSKMLDNYIKFLSTGSNKWPQEVFEVLGVNLEDKEVYENAIKYFDKLVDEYEKIYYDKEVGD